MLWSMILFFLLAATFNSSVDSAQSNYYKKIVIEHNGKKYINPYAFSDMNFTLETSVVEDFYFIVRKSNREVIPIKMSLSTDSPSMNVECDTKRNTMVCRTSSHDTVQHVSKFKDHTVELCSGYDDNGLHFLKDGLKYLLKSSSTFTPAYDTPLSSFLMEWPSSVNLQESQEQVQEAVIPPNYDVCEDSCDSLKNETGVKFGSKSTVEFTMALLDKEKEYKLLHSFGYFSPIYTLSGSTSCTNYSTTIKLNDIGSLTFTRDGEKMDIDTDFKPFEESLKDVPISNASNVNFYFYGSSIYCTFFDPQNAFQLRLLKLPKDLAMKSETILKIGHSSTVNECNETLKLLVRGAPSSQEHLS
uniref:Uncharacterized protein n=1 Tax=Panagrolaimus davidi TaxID=227884 RepID=A0A914P5A7_9BILA